MFGLEDQMHLAVASRPSADASISPTCGLAHPSPVMPTVDQDVRVRVSSRQALPLARTETAAKDLLPAETLRSGDASDA